MDLSAGIFLLEVFVGFVAFMVGLVGLIYGIQRTAERRRSREPESRHYSGWEKLIRGSIPLGELVGWFFGILGLVAAFTIFIDVFF